jgi:hypothetical protein
MKFKIKSLDDRVYKELEEFKKLGYEIEKYIYFFHLIKYKDGKEAKKIEMYLIKNQAIKFDILQDGILEPFTKEELKILDFYDWDLHDYMKNPLGQDVTDWVNNDEV